jgi:hypothetical protein
MRIYIQAHNANRRHEGIQRMHKIGSSSQTSNQPHASQACDMEIELTFRFARLSMGCCKAISTACSKAGPNMWV